MTIGGPTGHAGHLLQVRGLRMHFRLTPERGLVGAGAPFSYRRTLRTLVDGPASTWAIPPRRKPWGWSAWSLEERLFFVAQDHNGPLAILRSKAEAG